MSTGDEILLWPSGRTSAVVTHMPEGQLISITADDDKGTILANFDYRGVGGVQYPNGKPWLVVTLEGWSVSDKMGNILERGAFPRKFPPLSCTVNLGLTVTFKDRWDIQIKYINEETRREWQGGELLRRTESYTAKAIGSKNGKLLLDVASIRQRQKDVGSLYVPPGPHVHRTARAGLAGLKTTLKNLPEDDALTGTIRGLQESDSRVSMINNLPTTLYGTSRLGATGSLLSSTASTSSPASLQGSSRSSYMMSILQDYGSPTLSETQKRFKRRPKPEVYKSRRLKLKDLRSPDIESTLFAQESERGTLFVVCVLATWNPVCQKLETQLEFANCELRQEADSDPVSSAAQITVLKLNASDGTTLQTKYDFRTSPMFLFFFGRRLVSASSSTLSASQFKAEAKGALEKGKKGVFLPDTFTFKGDGMCGIDATNLISL